MGKRTIIDYCSYCGLRKVIVVDLGDYAMLCKKCADEIEENDNGGDS